MRIFATHDLCVYSLCMVYAYIWYVWFTLGSSAGRLHEQIRAPSECLRSGRARGSDFFGEWFRACESRNFCGTGFGPVALNTPSKLELGAVECFAVMRIELVPRV